MRRQKEERTMREKEHRGIRWMLGLFLLASVFYGFGTQSVSAAQVQEEQKIDYILGRPMTEEEIGRQKDLEPELTENVFEEEPVPSVGEPAENARNAPMRISYDSRTLGWVTPVKNQGNKWGTCWSHAVIACAETSLRSKNMMTMEEADLSELHLAYFMYHTPQDPLNNAVGDRTFLKGNKNYLERGGNMQMAAFPLANYIGFADEAIAPYDGDNLTEQLDEGIAYQDAAHLKNSYWLAASDTAQIKSLLMELGAASVSLYMDTDNYLNDSTGAYYCNTAEKGTNHEVAIIGWNDNYAVENFNSACRPSADGAWLAKNSWSDEWGDGGYFWISYEDALIKQSNFYFFDAETVTEGRKNYHYDGGAYNSARVFENKSSIANIFRASGSYAGAEKIDAVGFALVTPNVQYEIQIYKNVVDSKNPQSGIPVLKSPQKGTFHYCGYHTIPLEEEITVGENETFAVVVTVSQESGGGISCCVDESHIFKSSNDEEWCETETSESPGQSFYKNGPNAPWVDASTQKYTMRVKALTSPAEPVPVSSVTVKPKTMNLIETKKKQIKAVSAPAGATDYSLTWTSSNEKIAKVDASGMVTAVSPGECVITASSASGKSDSCTMKVQKLKKVTGLKAVKTTTSSIQFKWKKQKGVDGYQLHRRNATDHGPWEKICDLWGEDSNSYTDKGLKSGTNYEYVVYAFVEGGEGYKFGDMSNYLKTGTVDKKVKTPELSKASNAASGISVKWKKVSNADGYYIYRKEKGGKWKKISTVSKASATSFTDKSVKKKDGTLYSYTVAAYRGKTAGSYDKSGKKIVRMSAPELSKPVSESTGTIAVKWSWNKKADGYRIQYAQKRNFQKAKEINIRSGNSAGNTLKNLQKNKTYYVRIQSYKELGGKKYYSAWSAAQNVKIK